MSDFAYWWSYGTSAALLKLVVVAGLVVFGIKSCIESEGYQRDLAENEAKKRARETPHVVREVDGCKVYAFERGGRDHYFTRCGDVVATEGTWSESCGKHCTRQMSETIETRGNK